jgi:hypothetical protein
MSRFANFQTYLSLLSAFALLQAAVATAAEPPAKHVPIFDGTSFDGWRFVGKGVVDGKAPNWAVKNGVIALSGGGAPHLASEKEYADFEVIFEWRAMQPKYNSGFYIRSGENLGSNQINLARGGEGNLMYGKARGGVAVPKLQSLPGEWNSWRIRVEGDKATLWCNNVQAWEATGLTPEKGYIGFQAEGAAMEFRSIHIREIKN